MSRGKKKRGETHGRVRSHPRGGRAEGSALVQRKRRRKGNNILWYLLILVFMVTTTIDNYRLF